MVKDMKTRWWGVGLSIAGAFCIHSSAYSLDLPNCEDGEYLWLVTAGNPSGTIMPAADMRVSTATFQNWTDGNKTLRTAQFTNVPKGILGEAKTFERYSGGGNLGSFAKSWPTAVEGYEIDNFKSLPPRNPAPNTSGGNYSTDFASSYLLDGETGQTLAQVVSQSDFNGKLTYVAPAQARVDFVTLAICTSAIPIIEEEAKEPTATAPRRSFIEAINAAKNAVERASLAAQKAEISAASAAKTTADAAKDFRDDALKAAELANEELEKSRKAFINAASARTESAAKTAQNNALKAAQKAEAQELIAAQANAEAINAQALIESLAITEAKDAEEKNLAAIAIKDSYDEASRRWAEDVASASAEAKKIINSRGAELSEGVNEQQAKFITARKNRTKTDLLLGSSMAAAAALNIAANALANLIRGGMPLPKPLPAPNTVHTNGSKTGRKKEKHKKDKTPDFQDVPITETVVSFPASPQAAPLPKPVTQTAPLSVSSVQSTSSTEVNSDESSILQTSKKSILFPMSPSSAGPITDAPLAVGQAYAAVGRVGYPHVPRAARNAEGICFGSAVLIGPNKVLTNYHVWNLIKDKPGIGIEFEAREGNAVSEFITLETREPEIIEGHDAVVLTLSRKIARKPLWPIALDYDDANIIDREVYAIGHPVEPQDNGWMMLEAIETVFGRSDPLWNVKRYSAGPLVGHSEDVDDDILFDVPVREVINAAGLTPALCHRASSVGGNSGGAIICAENGDFLGLHFGGQYWKDEDVNYAVPGKALLVGLAALDIVEHGAAAQPNALKPAESSPNVNEEKTETPAAIIPPKVKKALSLEPLNGDLFGFEPDIETVDKTPTETVKPVITENEKEETPPSSPNGESFTQYLKERSPAPQDENGPDDLTLIEGIGPKTAAALKAGGITSFKALSHGSPYDLLPMLKAAGLVRRDPTTWPAQASLAAHGGWDRLRDWQDKLHGGRELT